jgi:hypothetical protein
MSHNEADEGDQYKSYKEVIKEGNDRSYALSSNKGHGGDRGRGKTKSTAGERIKNRLIY